MKERNQALDPAPSHAGDGLSYRTGCRCCGALLYLDGSRLGWRVKCPTCGKGFIVIAQQNPQLTPQTFQKPSRVRRRFREPVNRSAYRRRRRRGL